MTDPRDFALIAPESAVASESAGIARELSAAEKRRAKRAAERLNLKEPTVQITLGVVDEGAVVEAPFLVEPEAATISPPAGSPKPPRALKESVEPIWIPSEQELRTIHDLAELGWPVTKVAEALDITSQKLVKAMAGNPSIKEAYEKGVESNKSFPERRLAWMPSPANVEAVRRLAAKGFNEAAIAAKLGVSRGSFTRRMADTPQLKEAYEEGNGEHQAELLETAQDLLKRQDPGLKFVSSLLIFKLKSYCGLTDKQEKEPLRLEGKIEHRHTLNAPAPVPVNQIADYAKQEMARAAQISAEKLKVVVKESEAIEAEVKDVS